MAISFRSTSSSLAAGQADGFMGGDGSNDGATVSLNSRCQIPKCYPRLNHARKRLCSRSKRFVKRTRVRKVFLHAPLRAASERPAKCEGIGIDGHASAVHNRRRLLASRYQILRAKASAKLQFYFIDIRFTAAHSLSARQTIPILNGRS